MRSWNKPASPVDRVMSEVDQQLATVQRRILEVSIDTRTPTSVRKSTEDSEPFRAFVKKMLSPVRGSVEPTYRTVPVELGVDPETLKELESEPLPFGTKAEVDLFTNATKPPKTRSSDEEEKLTRYLGVGGIKTYKPLRGVERQTRNRFYMWLGLSCLALWIIWVVVR